MKAQEIIQLRQLLAQRFPHARTWKESATPKPRACWPTGLPQVDEWLQGGLPQGAITELVSAKPGCGSALLLHALLRQIARTGQLAGLVDGLDSLDAAALEPATLSRLLWIRCKQAGEALKATDILLRDRNLPLVLLDLQMNPTAQLRKISGTTWFRLQRIVQQTATAFLVLTPQPMVSSTELRLFLTNQFDLSAVTAADEDLLLQLELTQASVGETASTLAG